MNGTVSTAMRQSGMNYKLNYGLDAVNIREIASRYQPNEILADKLWKENSRECKILGTLLQPKTSFNREKANTWQADCFLPELTEQLCFNLLQHLEFAPELATDWVNNPSESMREAGYTLALRLLLKKTSIADIEEIKRHATTDFNSENYRLKLTASRFLERANF